MRKLLAILLVLAMCISVVGCGSTGDNSGENSQPTDSSQTNSDDSSSVDDRVSTMLTAENVYEYLLFQVEISDVKVKTMSNGFSNGDANLTVKVIPNPDKPGEYKDVVVQVTLKGLSSGWVADSRWDSREKSITIPANGTTQMTYKVTSNVTEEPVSENPYFQIVVNEVSGEILQ